MSEMRVTLNRKNGMPLSDIPELDVPDMGLPGASDEFARLCTRALARSG